MMFKTRQDVTLGYTFIISVGMLCVGLLLCLRGLPTSRSLLGTAIGFICAAVHAATVYYARHILFSIP